MSARFPATATLCARRPRLPRRTFAQSEVLPVPLPIALRVWLARQGFPGLCSRDSGGDTPLMRAAGLGEETMLAMLLAYAAAPEAHNDEGNTALWFACQHGAPGAIARLLHAGCAVDHANDADMTCLMQAAQSGRLDIMQLLLAYGANPRLCAPDGRSALDMLAQQGLQLTPLLQLGRSLPAPREATP